MLPAAGEGRCQGGSIPRGEWAPPGGGEVALGSLAEALGSFVVALESFVVALSSAAYLSFLEGLLGRLMALLQP